MMSKLTRLRDEALRLLTTYEEHRESKDDILRRKAHLDLDKFLMENRETAIMLIVRGLNDEIQRLRDEETAKGKKKRRWFSRKKKGVGLDANYRYPQRQAGNPVE